MSSEYHDMSLLGAIVEKMICDLVFLYKDIDGEASREGVMSSLRLRLTEVANSLSYLDNQARRVHLLSIIDTALEELKSGEAV